MAVRKIETTIELNGEQEFKRSLASAAREMRVLESESKALAASFGTSGDAAAAAAAKQRNLKNQVAQQEQIVSALEQAVKDAAKAYGESSYQVDGYAIKLNNARARLANLQKALVSSDREVEELGRDAIKAGRQIEDGIGDGAREAQKELTDLMSTMQDSLSAIQSNTAVTAIKTVWDTASGAFQAVDGFVTGTQDYRRQLSFLEMNAEESGFDFAALKGKLIEITSLTGEASSAISGLSYILATPGMDEYKMQRLIEGLGGAVVKFPDMDFSSLADGFQETIAKGEAGGTFLELLERLGADVEKFNEALKASPTAAGDVEAALAQLAAGGLNDTYTKWHDTNEEMAEAMGTQAILETELAEFAGTLEKYITTPVKKIAADTIGYINEIVKAAEKGGPEEVKEKIEGDLNKVMEAAGIPSAGDVKDFVYSFTPMGVADKVEEYLSVPRKSGKPDATPEELKQAISDWQDYNNNAEEAGAEAGADFAAGFADALDPTLWGEGKEATPLETIGERTMDEVLKKIDLDAYYKEMNEAGKEGGEQLMEGLEEGSEGAATAGRERGAAFGAAYAQGIMSQVSYVSAAAGALAAAAAARAAAAAVPSAGAGGNLNLALNIDGKTFARATAPYMSSALAVAL